MKRRPRDTSLWKKSLGPLPAVKVAKKPKRRGGVFSAKRRKPNKVVEAPDFTAEPTHIPLNLAFRDPFKYQKTFQRPYQYRPLDSSRNEIRLLQLPPLQIWDDNQETQTISNAIEATLIHVALDESPEYEALSYRWSAENKEAVITIDAHSVWISRTLKRALQGLRVSMKSKAVWVDALCINQQDDKERNEQVSKMRNIYSQAKEVVAWLGEATYFTPFTFSLIGDLHRHIDDSIYIENALLDIRRRPHWAALVEILSLEYWKRVWVIQEVNSARKLTMRCGNYTINWKHFAAVQDKLAQSVNVKTYSFGSDLDLWWGIASGGPRVLNIPCSDEDHGLPNLSKALTFFKTHLATDPRDMVYALVGITNARADPEMQIDYSQSVRQVYINVVDYVVKREVKLDVICGKLTWTAIPGLPSWTPDWGSSYIRSTRPLISRPPGIRSFSASKIIPAQATIDTEVGLLRARGIRVDSVSVLGNATDTTNLGARNDFQGMVIAILEWYMSLMQHCYDETEGYDEAFTRAITCDTHQDNPMLTKKILGAFPRLATNFELPVPDRLKPLADALNESDSWIDSWMRFTWGCLYGRQLFVSGQGLMGLCPKNYKEGDIIVILLGCAVPLLLRPCSEGDYELVGDVYLNGYMYGKGIDELNKGRLELETFEIS